MPSLRGFTGFDQGFEAEPLARPVCPTTMRANWILAHLEAQEGKAAWAVVGQEGMGQLGFARFQTNSDMG
jgi:hypothetical protein